MQVVILAGGLGMRLRPITEQVPKPMVEVGGRPFLDHIVRYLAAQGFDRFLLLVGHLAEKVQQYFGNGARHGISIQYSFEPQPLGTGGAIRYALAGIDEEFLLLYGDSFLPIDYPAVVDAFRHARCLGLMVAYDNRLADTGVLGNVAVDDQGWVCRYEKNTGSAGLDYVEAGALCFRKAVFRGLPAKQNVSLEREVYPRLIAARQLCAWITAERFFDIGTPERLQEFAAVQP